VDLFSKGRRQTERNAKAYARSQGLEWEGLSAGRKFGILNAAAVAERRSKGDGLTEREGWRDQGERIGWTHTTVLEGATAPTLSDAERFDRAYEFVARHLADEFHTAAVIDHSKLRTLSARGMILTGISGPEDIDQVVQLVEQRGITLRGEKVSLIVGEIANKAALEAGKIVMKVRVTNSAFLRGLEDGRVALSRNTVLVVDELSQIGPRPFLRLLELQAEHGFTLKGLGDREQVQAIEAGDTIEIMRRSLPKEAMSELLTTVRQETLRGRRIAGLFREGKATEALEMKRDDGTVRMVGGDQDEVIGHIADLYMQRRDALRASGARHLDFGHITGP